MSHERGIYMGNMLAVGRALGLNNVSELQNLRRLVRSKDAGKVQAHFVITGSEGGDAFISSSNPQVLSFKTLCQRLFPKSFSETAQTFIDVFLNKNRSGINAKQGSLTINTLTRNGHDVVNISETRVLSNEAGVIFNMTANGEAGLQSDMFMHYSHYSKGKFSLQDILKAIEYKEASGLGTLKLDYRGSGKVKVLTSMIKAPVELINRISAESSSKSFKDFLASSNL